MARREYNLKIYIAGPYSADCAKCIHANVISAIDAGIELWKKGHNPYIPHLTHFVDQRAKITNTPMAWNDYIEWDKVWLETCDALLFLGSSKGANLELDLAKKMGKRIFFSINSVPEAVKQKDRIIVEC
jgi:hypothetical protein